MNAGSLFFVDTNVLLYCIDNQDAEKRRLARSWRNRLWESNAGRLSWQVLNEFYWNAAGKMRARASVVRQLVEDYSLWGPSGFGLGLARLAWYWMDEAGVPYWDALILASAETAGCAYLLSEDFQAGRRFGGITVVSPFQSRPEEFGLR
jgi:predicted nucleic acid-binding protein